MSANPHSVVHSRQYVDIEKTKDEQPRKAEPGVKGMVGCTARFPASGVLGHFGPVTCAMFSLICSLFIYAIACIWLFEILLLYCM